MQKMFGYITCKDVDSLVCLQVPCRDVVSPTVWIIICVSSSSLIQIMLGHMPCKDICSHLSGSYFDSSGFSGVDPNNQIVCTRRIDLESKLNPVREVKKIKKKK